jgi:hypothetical protein
MRISRALKPSERGQSLVELALGLLVLIILVMGIIDLGRALFYYTTLRDAAQEGVIYGSINPQDCYGIVARARSPLANSTEGTIEVEVYMKGIDGLAHSCNVAPIASACSGQQIEVIVTQPTFPLVTPILGTFLGTDHLKLVSSVTGTILRPTCP